ncbi:unnamed protein product [Vicia faba]|uniref:Uncharacterized protein n=1 Tax=Vicia faba TaxID=3906 RepID=A0AAV1ADE4_VICFA|nr:unnamed protein product [Vicia faba]
MHFKSDPLGFLVNIVSTETERNFFVNFCRNGRVLSSEITSCPSHPPYGYGRSRTAHPQNYGMRLSSHLYSTKLETRWRGEKRCGAAELRLDFGEQHKHGGATGRMDVVRQSGGWTSSSAVTLCFERN